ncbi:hypothetical protein FMM58_02265 [Campylobacter sp. LR291e]|uniref:COG3014 family protein n=1 Tax=Campylobacter sp. LR291e TaxID=2593546 RepID=UPI00123AFA71|nr:hypothetical protein [Campylobacter sp. LR291e]KAA6233448.1 hypothetical protein FMM58_02265 [Campylobacter sp. LR291e]
MYKICLNAIIALLFVACSSHEQYNAYYQQILISQTCDPNFFEKENEDINEDDDSIYKGLNTGYIARDCKEFKLSNDIFDKVENSYKFDVDLEGSFSKGAKYTTSLLVNDTIFDYQGYLYERIMLNAYKGLNFMQENDFENARVEFNRVLIRQDRAKDYFDAQIEENQEDIQKAKQNDKYYTQNVENNAKDIYEKYEHLFDDFQAQKDFTNPYATYLASVFFFLDKDYKRAQDLLKEVYATYPKNDELQKEFKIFNNFSNSLRTNELQKYIFVVYEDGLSPQIDEWKFSLPFIFNKGVATISIALPTLTKRGHSYEYILINDDFKSELIFDFDSIVASEFKTNLSTIITKALLSSILKTGLTIATTQYNSDNTWVNMSMALLNISMSIYNVASTQSDVRYWNFLPKQIHIAMLENQGFIDIKAPSGLRLFSSQLDLSKNVLIVLRSFAPQIPSRIYKMEN